MLPAFQRSENPAIFSGTLIGVHHFSRNYGFDEKIGAFVKNGQSISNWNQDNGMSSERQYDCVPFYILNRGYAILFDHPGEAESEEDLDRDNKLIYRYLFNNSVNKTPPSLDFRIMALDIISDRLRFRRLCPDSCKARRIRNVMFAFSTSIVFGRNSSNEVLSRLCNVKSLRVD
ncbi:hypothetical protein ACEPAI_4979 [Sanghuangporus weigelae]